MLCLRTNRLTSPGRHILATCPPLEQPCIRSRKKVWLFRSLLCFLGQQSFCHRRSFQRFDPAAYRAHKFFHIRFVKPPQYAFPAVCKASCRIIAAMLKKIIESPTTFAVIPLDVQEARPKCPKVSLGESNGI